MSFVGVSKFSIITEATRQRMASGQGIKAKAGFQVWLDAGGRELLSRMAKSRWFLLELGT